VEANIYHIRIFVYLLINEKVKKVDSIYEIANSHLWKGKGGTNQPPYKKALLDLKNEGVVLQTEEGIVLRPDEGIKLLTMEGCDDVIKNNVDFFIECLKNHPNHNTTDLKNMGIDFIDTTLGKKVKENTLK